MRRRDFVISASVAFAWPTIAMPQAKQLPLIGVITLDAKSDIRTEAFIAGMRELGYTEGKTIAIEWRFTDGESASLSKHAADLVRMRPKLIVAAHPQAVEAVRRLTTTIPIVFAVGQDPVGMGWAKSLAHPGGNITGHSSMSADMGVKHIETLRAALPNCTRVAVLLNPTNAAGAAILRKSYEAAAQNFGVRIDFHAAGTKDELEPAMLAIKNAGAQAVIVAPDGLLFGQRQRIAELAVQHRMPSLFLQREAAMAGALLSYGPDGRDQYRRAAYYVHRILNGARPGDLPIEQPTKFNLTINLKTAKSLGITIPKALLLRTDDVID